MCDKPLIAVRYGFDPGTGKSKIKIKRIVEFSLEDYFRRYGPENVLLIPCGHCSACILAKRREWAVRVQCEAKDHVFNCFITLTYDDEHYPDRKTWRTDYKRFIKAIRNDGYKVRYFGCGEVGSQSSRRHLHIILFGFCPSDLVYEGKSDSGEALYSSNYISSIWKKGHSIVQQCDGSVGSYVAGYTSKKLGNGEGFQFQSTKPGIGFNYIFKHPEILKYDRMFGEFGSVKIPRYFEKVLADRGYSFYLDILKSERIEKALSEQYRQAREHGFTLLDEQVFYSRSFNDNKLSKLVRCL